MTTPRSAPLTTSAVTLMEMAHPAPEAREVSTSILDHFVRIGHQSAVVIGDYLYIDGGETSQYVDAEKTLLDLPKALNQTLSIALTESWNNQTVTIRAIEKGDAPDLKEQAIWLDRSTSSFYTFGGQASYGKGVPERALWRFIADGSGGGSWSRETPKDPSFLIQLVRAFGGSSATSTDTGYFLGGYADSWTDPAFSSKSNRVAIPGLVSFNLTSKVFANETSSPVNVYGTSVAGKAEFVPSFGAKGLVLFMGGLAIKGSPFTKMSDGETLPLTNITIYDPEKRDWHWQTATGDVPSRRESFCTVGVQGPDSTYEIFLFGGYHSRLRTAYDDIYVLTLPGFVWSKANYTSRSPRAHHTCALVGKRQMVTVGGLNYGPDALEVWSDRDTFEKGLGIFDMTAMEWRDRYDADAASYDSPRVVKEWYAQRGLSSVSWSSPAVRDIFLHNSPTDSKSSGPQGGNENQSNSSNITSKAAIIGGTVGGSIFLSLVTIFLYYYLRKRRRSNTHNDDGGEDSPIEQADGFYHPKPMSLMTIDTPIEMNGRSSIEELDSAATERYELDSPAEHKHGRGMIQELSAIVKA